MNENERNDIRKSNSRRLLVIEIAAVLIFVLQAVTTALVLPRAIKAMDSVTELAERFDVEMPIAQAVRRVLWEGLDPHVITEEFFDRPSKSEVE